MKVSKLLMWMLAIALPMYAVGDEGGGTDTIAGGADTVSAASGTDTITGGADGDSTVDGGASTGDNGGDDTVKGGDGSGSDDGKLDFAKLELPDGMTLDQVVVDRFAPLMEGMDQATAQKFATAFAELRQADATDRIEAFSQQKQEWFDVSRSDKEFGGDKFDESAKLAVQAVEKFGTPELRQFMDDYGVGNHPELIRFMVKVGRATQEDNPGGGVGGTSSTPQDRVSILYPDAKKQ